MNQVFLPDLLLYNIALSKKPLKKLNFNKIIAFIFYHIAKLVIIMLLFTHCTGIFISHCTSYNAKGDINNNTLLLQDRWLHCGHSGPLPLRFLFFMFTVYSEKTTILNSPHCFIFSLFLFFFFCSFFKMQVERRAFNGLSTIPDSPGLKLFNEFLLKMNKMFVASWWISVFKRL